MKSLRGGCFAQRNLCKSPRVGETCKSEGLKDLGPGNVDRKGESVRPGACCFFPRAFVTFCNLCVLFIVAFAHCTFNSGYILAPQRALKNSFLGPNKDQLNQDLWDYTWDLALLQCAQVILMYPQS